MKKRALLCLASGLLLSLPTAEPVRAADDLAGIDEIRVSITRRDESLQDVAATISAFDQSAIRELNIETLQDVITLIPNAQIKDAGNGAIAIRGITQSFTGQSPVAAHLNGIFQFTTATYGDLYDIETIEVQRGPVGVVYGRNATAGAINVTWKRPTADWEAFGDVTLGSFDRRQFRGGVNVPLLGEGDDRLTARFVLQRDIRDAALRNTEGRRRDGGTDAWTFRGTLRWQPDEDTVAHWRGYWSKDEEASGTVGIPRFADSAPRVSDFDLQQLGVHPFDPYDGLVQFKQSLLTSPQSVIYALASNVALAACQPVVTALCVDPGIQTQDDALENILVNGAGTLLPGVLRDPSYFGDITIADDRDRRLATNAFDVQDPENEVYFTDMDFERRFANVPLLGDLVLSVAGGYYRQKEQFFAEVDGTILEIVNNYRSDETENWVGEMRLHSDGEQPVNWTLGLFWYDRELYRNDFTRVPFVQTGTLARIEESGFAPFANMTVRPFDWTEWSEAIDVEVFMGVRKNRDRYSRKTTELPTPLTSGGSNHVKDIFREMTYEVGLKWFATEDQTLYAKYSKGYKAGIVEFDDPALLPGRPNPVEEEIVRAWEVGWKANWPDQRLNTALTAFHYDYTNLQVPKIAGFQVLTENAGGATNWGIEFEARWFPTDDWLIQIAAGYLDATFDEFCSSDDLDPRGVALSDPACIAKITDQTTALQDLAGNQLEDAAKWSFSLISRYEWDLGEYGTLTPVIAFAWKDDSTRRPFNVAGVDRIEAYTQTDIRFIWESADGRYSVEVFGENLEEDFFYGRTITVQLPYVAAAFGPIGQRIYGVRLGFRFGGE